MSHDFNLGCISWMVTFDLGWHWKVKSRSFGVIWAVYHTKCIIRQRSYQAERPLVLLLYICLLCDEIFLPWNVGTFGFEVRDPQDPKNKIKIIFFILTKTLSDYFHIYMCIDACEWSLESKKCRSDYWSVSQHPHHPNRQQCTFTLWPIYIWTRGLLVRWLCHF